MKFIDYLNEAHISRFFMHLKDENMAIAIISSDRKENTKQENDENYRSLKDFTIKAKFGYVKVKGGYIENKGSKDEVKIDGEKSIILYADKNECLKLVKEAGIDCLAPALGSVHGPYHGEPKLGFKEMEEINELVKIPLVLHGGSGIPDFQLKMAIDRGTSKINVNTENQQAFAKIVREICATTDPVKVYDPRKILGPAKQGIRDVVKAKCEVFGCINKA